MYLTCNSIFVLYCPSANMRGLCLHLPIVSLGRHHGVKSVLTAFGVCLWVLVEMLNATRVERAGASHNTMNL